MSLSTSEIVPSAPAVGQGIDCTDNGEKVEALSPRKTKALCVVCDRQPSKAISIAGFLLCEECESRIVRVSPSDPDYDQLVSHMRQFWNGLAEAAASRD